MNRFLPFVSLTSLKFHFWCIAHFLLKPSSFSISSRLNSDHCSLSPRSSPSGSNTSPFQPHLELLFIHYLVPRVINAKPLHLFHLHIFFYIISIPIIFVVSMSLFPRAFHFAMLLCPHHHMPSVQSSSLGQVCRLELTWIRKHFSCRKAESHIGDSLAVSPCLSLPGGVILT